MKKLFYQMFDLIYKSDLLKTFDEVQIFEENQPKPTKREISL